MGCSSSKSTPAVEDQAPSEDDIKNSILKNGRSMVEGVEAKLNEAREAARNAAENLESTLLNSPETERAGNLDEECAESTAENRGSDIADSETPNTMTLNMRKSDDDSDGLLNTDKPPTPMPEYRSLSNETLCNGNDESGSYTSEQQSGYGGNGDTLKSNIFKAVCNTAANIAMQDSDTEDCSQSNNGSESSRTGTMRSDCSQNSMKTNCQLSGRSSPESACESESQSIRRGRNTRRTNHEQNYGTYERLGRQLWNDLENNQDMRMSIPCILDMVKKANFSASGNKAMNINANMGLKQNTKSIARSLKY